jgi:hypothetical protein
MYRRQWKSAKLKAESKKQIKVIAGRRPLDKLRAGCLAKMRMPYWASL